MYGASWPSLVSAKICRRTSFSGGMPALAGPGHVDRRQVERQAEQVVAQGLGDELVELVADLVRRAHDDRAGRLLRRAACRPRRR